MDQTQVCSCSVFFFTANSMLQLQVCSQTKTLEERVNFVRKCGGCRKLRTVILYSNLIGFYSLAIIYFAFAFSNLFLATLIVSKVGNRLSMVFGGLGYCLFIASFEYVILPVFYGFSALMGFCARYGLVHKTLAFPNKKKKDPLQAQTHTPTLSLSLSFV